MNKNILTILCMMTLFVHISSCVSRGDPIESQVVFYMDKYELDKFTAVTQDDGQIVYYPNEIVQEIKEDKLYRFNEGDYILTEINNVPYYVPKNRALVRRVQEMRKNEGLAITDSGPKIIEKTTGSKVEVIVVGEEAGLLEFEPAQQSEQQEVDASSQSGYAH